ncbi:MAG: hypothetical protein L6R38_006633, partial [Xanthoria sp. 2 TBL-2021]
MGQTSHRSPLAHRNLELIDTGDQFPQELIAALQKKEQHLQEETEGSTKMTYFHKAWQLRAIATLPRLLTLQQRYPDLKFTWKQFVDRRYLGNTNSPYHQTAKDLCKDAAK